MENLNTALILMIVGMVTVFIILLIVINLGKLLIALVNRYAPPEEAAQPKRSKAPAPIPSNVVAAITAAVNVVTHNKGRITNIEKM
jgi:oxaloacetate decarboxylase gamma subunit